jgi:glycosyltransferase involved in cell wall biosynthesis
VKAPPRVTVGLPVHNGENYLTQALDSLLAQTFTDFELVVSDNHSTDATEEICRTYAARDPRIRYLRQERNIGAIPNHNALVGEARAPYFKWAAHDDVYGPELLERCVAVLDQEPGVVLCHADKAVIDGGGTVVQELDYLLDTGSSDPVERFRSLVVADGADDEYGVMRTRVLRRVRPHDSYHHAGRPFIAEIAFQGRFHQVRERLYFRRDHPRRGDRRATIPAVSANLDPRRAGQSTTRLMAEYAYRYFETVARAPITRSQKLACYRILAWRLSGSGLHRVRSRNGDPLWAAGQPAHTYSPARAGTTRGDARS